MIKEVIFKKKFIIFILVNVGAITGAYFLFLFLNNNYNINSSIYIALTGIFITNFWYIVNIYRDNKKIREALKPIFVFKGGELPFLHIRNIGNKPALDILIKMEEEYTEYEGIFTKWINELYYYFLPDSLASTSFLSENYDKKIDYLLESMGIDFLILNNSFINKLNLFFDEKISKDELFLKISLQYKDINYTEYKEKFKLKSEIESFTYDDEENREYYSYLKNDFDKNKERIKDLMNNNNLLKKVKIKFNISAEKIKPNFL